MSESYIRLRDLEVYKLGRELSRLGWSIYKALDWEARKIVGQQFIQATDSFAANIAEGYTRYHYLEKIKFFYNARASLEESTQWLELLKERDLLREQEFRRFLEIAKPASVKLQNLISANYRSKNN